MKGLDGKGVLGVERMIIEASGSEMGRGQMEVPEGQGWLGHLAPGDGNWAAALEEAGRHPQTPAPPHAPTAANIHRSRALCWGVWLPPPEFKKVGLPGQIQGREAAGGGESVR